MNAAAVGSNVPPGRHVIEVDYRFVLAPHTAPGSYPWPLEVVVRRATPHHFGLTNYDRRGIALGAR